MIPPIGCSLITPEHSSLGRAEPTKGLHPYTVNTMAAHATTARFKPVLAEKSVSVTCFVPVNSYIPNWAPQNYFTDTGVKGGPKIMQSNLKGHSPFTFFDMLAARSHLRPCYYSVLNSASEIRFVLKVDRSAGVLHYYQFLFPCTTNELCRNTCMYLKVSSAPFVRKAGSSNRLQSIGSHSNSKGKNVLNIKIIIPLKQME